MKQYILLLILIASFSAAALAQEDNQGCKDPEMFTRFPNFYIADCSENFNELELRISSSGTETKEGNLIIIGYRFNFDSGEKMKSPLQIMKNYENAVIKIGGKLVFKNTDAMEADLEATYHCTTKDKEYWIKLARFGGNGIEVENYALYILEMEPMKQEVDANAMFEALNKDGFIALYINFETGKSEIQAESVPLVDQIVALLKQNPDLKISIEGHTDNVGTETSNQTLSENRAKSVMNTVMAAGIDKSRLIAKGWGQSKPVADNRTEDGRAKNRRVEIVKF